MIYSNIAVPLEKRGQSRPEDQRLEQNIQHDKYVNDDRLLIKVKTVDHIMNIFNGTPLSKLNKGKNTFRSATRLIGKVFDFGRPEILF